MIKKLFSSQLRINMASGVVVTVIKSVAMIVAYPVYLHFLGYEKYGVWLVLATVLDFAQLGNIGIDQAVMKLVAEEHGRNNIEGIQKYVTNALALLCLSGTVVLIVILVFKTQLIAVFKLSGENATVVLWLLPYIGILSIYVLVVQALNATLSGLGRMDLANYIQSVGRIVAVTVATILLCGGRGIKSLLIGNTLSYIFIHIVSLICIRRIAHIRILRINNLDAQCGRRILHFGGAVFGGSVIGMLLSPFNKLMLSRYAGVSAVPVYEIAFKGSMQVRGLIEAGLRALMPEISRIGANMTRNAKDRISHMYRRAMKGIFLFGIPMYGAMIMLAPLLLRVWLGDRFVEALPAAFRIMLVGTFLSLLCVPAYYTLMALRGVHYCFLSQVFQGIVNAGVVGIIILFTGMVSIRAVALAVMLAMGVTSFYVVCQNRSTMRKLPVSAGAVSGPVSPASCVIPES